MTWTFPPQPHRVFERNPLVAVVVELRFFPILKLPDNVANLQELVRARFPAFQHAKKEMITFGPAPVEVRAEQFFTFTKADDSATLTLSTSSLALESRRHERRDQFIADFRFGLDALISVSGSVVPSRLGLRYVNVIDRDQVKLISGVRRLGTAWWRRASYPFLRGWRI